MQIDKQKIKKNVGIFLVIFLFLNAWMYNIEYKRYVSNAPTLLKPAREKFANALIFHMYYTFFVKTLRIDFQNPVLWPLKAPRDFFYHEGLALLPHNDAESALWFDFFEVRLYNYSCRAAYGSMAETYGYDFAKVFTERVYENIEILTTNTLLDPSSKELGDSALESYLDMIDVYLYDSHLSPQGVLFTDEYMHDISKSKEKNERFIKLYQWEKIVLNRYKQTNLPQYQKVMNEARGWYSPYVNYWDRQLILPSFILFYKISNEEFDCIKDAQYLEAISLARHKLLEAAHRFSIGERQLAMLNMEISYLNIDNRKDYNPIFDPGTNPLNLSINCIKGESE